MPVSTEDRAAYAKLDVAARDAAIYDQLKRIRENATGPAMNHEAVNDALDRIEVLWNVDDKIVKPAAHVGGTGGPSQNPAPSAKPVAQPAD